MKAKMYHTADAPAVLERKEGEMNPHRRTAVHAVALYPILKRQHPALALGYAGVRIAEVAIAAVGFGRGGLLLVSLGATAAHRASSETPGTLLVALRHWIRMLVHVYTALGGLRLSYMLLRTRLVPRWLAMLGLIIVTCPR